MYIGRIKLDKKLNYGISLGRNILSNRIEFMVWLFKVNKLPKKPYSMGVLIEDIDKRGFFFNYEF